MLAEDYREVAIMIGDRIRIRRKALKLSAETLAEKLGVIRNTIYRWEAGERTPSDEDKRRLAIALETSVSYLLEEIDDPLQLAVRDYPEGPVSDILEEEPDPESKEINLRIPGNMAIDDPEMLQKLLQDFKKRYAPDENDDFEIEIRRQKRLDDYSRQVREARRKKS